MARAFLFINPALTLGTGMLLLGSRLIPVPTVPPAETEAGKGTPTSLVIPPELKSVPSFPSPELSNSLSIDSSFPSRLSLGSISPGLEPHLRLDGASSSLVLNEPNLEPVLRELFQDKGFQREFNPDFSRISRQVEEIEVLSAASTEVGRSREDLVRLAEQRKKLKRDLESLGWKMYAWLLLTGSYNQVVLAIKQKQPVVLVAAGMGAGAAVLFAVNPNWLARGVSYLSLGAYMKGMMNMVDNRTKPDEEKRLFDLDILVNREKLTESALRRTGDESPSLIGEWFYQAGEAVRHTVDDLFRVPYQRFGQAVWQGVQPKALRSHGERLAQAMRHPEQSARDAGKRLTEVKSTGMQCAATSVLMDLGGLGLLAAQAGDNATVAQVGLGAFAAGGMFSLSFLLAEAAQSKLPTTKVGIFMGVPLLIAGDFIPANEMALAIGTKMVGSFGISMYGLEKALYQDEGAKKSSENQP